MTSLHGPTEVLQAALASKPKKKISKSDLWEVDSEVGRRWCFWRLGGPKARLFGFDGFSGQSSFKFVFEWVLSYYKLHLLWGMRTPPLTNIFEKA